METWQVVGMLVGILLFTITSLVLNIVYFKRRIKELEKELAYCEVLRKAAIKNDRRKKERRHESD